MLSKIGPIPASLVFSRYIKPSVTNGLLPRTAFKVSPPARLCLRLTTCVILGQPRKTLQARNGMKLTSCNKKKSIGFLRCSLGTAATLLNRLLQDSKSLAGSGCGYRGRLSGGAFEVNHSIFAGAEVAHTGLVEHGCRTSNGISQHQCARYYTTN